MISLLGLIFSSAFNQGVFGNVIISGDSANYTAFGINNSNWTVQDTGTVLQPPICEPIIQGVTLPILDDIGCLGVIMFWLGGLRNIGWSTPFFTVLFFLPIAIVSLVMIVRLLRGN